MSPIIVFGVPAPQGSKRAFVRNGKAVLTESAGASHKAWRIAVAETCNAAWTGKATLDGPLAVTIKFSMPRPKAAAKRHWHDRRPDLDKLVRSTLDGITDAGVIADDARIAHLTATKFYTSDTNAWTGAEITVAPILEGTR
jgi:crossover junction endodeoxyribonuclease RusA